MNIRTEYENYKKSVKSIIETNIISIINKYVSYYDYLKSKEIPQYELPRLPRNVTDSFKMKKVQLALQCSLPSFFVAFSDEFQFSKSYVCWKRSGKGVVKCL